MSIHSTIETFQRRRADYAKRLHDLLSSATSDGPVTTGVRIYEQMAEARWKIDAIDYVLSGVGTGVSAEEFLSTLDGIRRDLVACGSRPVNGLRSEPNAYWEELGKMERDMALAENEAKRMLRDKAVAASLRA